MIHKSIHVVQDGDQFSVVVYVNGKMDASYPSGSREWADKLAAALAANDDCRAIVKSRNRP